MQRLSFFINNGICIAVWFMSENFTAKDVEKETNPQKRNEKYNAYVESRTPKFSWCLNCLKAFLIGGLICTLGEALVAWYQTFGLSKEDAVLYEIITLVLLSVVATGFHWYPALAKFGGAGTIVPITGFANSVAACALDAKAEGQVFGIGCKIFTIAGPVILYGIFASWAAGFIYWLWTVFF